MLLTDITKSSGCCWGVLEEVASQDELDPAANRPDRPGDRRSRRRRRNRRRTGPERDRKRVEEAHDIIHRIAAILAMEEGRGGQDNILREELWDGKLDGETIALAEDEEDYAIASGY